MSCPLVALRGGPLLAAGAYDGGWYVFGGKGLVALGGGVYGGLTYGADGGFTGIGRLITGEYDGALAGTPALN